MTIHFLFGDDSYRLQKRLREIQGTIKTGDFGVSQIDASEKWDINRFENELTAIGFFGGERLVIVKNLLASKEVDVESVIRLLKNLCHSESASRRDEESRDPSLANTLAQDDKKDEIPAYAGMTNGEDGVTVIIIENGVPDKRGKLYKWLQKNGRSEGFLKLAGAEWNKFASDIIASRQIKIAPSAHQTLITETEGDSWQLINVLDQLEAWYININKKHHPVDKNRHPVLDTGSKKTEEGILNQVQYDVKYHDRILEQDDINLFVSRKSHGDSFKLLDAIARGNITIALRHISDLWSQGEAPLRVLGAIVFQYRQLVVIKSALDDNINPYEIAKECKIHPFVASKLTPLARNTDWDKLKTIYDEIAKIDEALKSGKIEPEAGLEILVYNLMNLHKNCKHKINLSSLSSIK